MKKILCVLPLTLLLFLSHAFANDYTKGEHSGRTDSSGCHVDHSTGTRHCH